MKFNQELWTNQFRLSILGYYRGKNDGLDGALTKQAAGAFQKDHKLRQDRIIGDATSREISIEFFKEIQEMLKFIDLYDGKIDGQPGVKTLKGIETLQKMNPKLVNDKIVGPATYAFLDEKVEEKEEALEKVVDIDHFRKEEFRCHCGGRYCNGFGGKTPDPQLLKNLEAVRKEFGNNAITVTSGYRCQRYNDSLVGSIPNSKHTFFKAADIRISGGKCSTWAKREKVVAFWKTLPNHGYAYQGTKNMGKSVHVDVK